MSNTSGRPDSKISNLRTPSQTYLLGESNYSARYIIGIAGPLYIRLAHNNSSNMAYIDGHIDSLIEQPPTKTFDDTAPWNQK
jgi:prepilin-type processing-associated H-X9-DG protein